MNRKSSSFYLTYLLFPYMFMNWRSQSTRLREFIFSLICIFWFFKVLHVIFIETTNKILILTDFVSYIVFSLSHVYLKITLNLIYNVNVLSSSKFYNTLYVSKNRVYQKSSWQQITIQRKHIGYICTAMQWQLKRMTLIVFKKL